MPRARDLLCELRRPRLKRHPLKAVSSSMTPNILMPSPETAYCSACTAICRKPSVSTSALTTSWCGMGLWAATSFSCRRLASRHGRMCLRPTSYSLECCFAMRASSFGSCLLSVVYVPASSCGFSSTGFVLSTSVWVKGFVPITCVGGFGRMSKLLPICAIVLSLASTGYSYWVSGGGPAAAHDPTYLKRAFDGGRLRFDVRGLRNEPTTTTYGAVSYTHKANIIVGGDAELVGLPFVVYFTVKRVSGGNPESARPSDEWNAALVKDGYGELAVSGGYKAAEAKWSPEIVEIQFVGVSPIVPMLGPVMRGI